MANRKSTQPAAKKKVAVVKKKTPVKKVASKKAVVKKLVTKKVAPKKAVAKKTPVKKVTPKKPIVKKITIKVKDAPKKVILKKKTAVPPKNKSTVKPLNTSLPALSALSEETVEKAAHPAQVVNQDTDQNNGLNNTSTRTEDPLRSFDKHEFQKATAKGDPRSKLHLSTLGKKPIRPSGKKPLWNK